MNIFILPSDIQREIRSYLHVKDLVNLYEAYEVQPSQELVTETAILNHLPDTRTLYQLLPLSKMSLPSRIKFCIETYDIPSFARLIGKIDNLKPLFADFYRRWRKYPKLASCYYLEKRRRGIYHSDDFHLVIASKDTNLLHKYLRVTDKLPSDYLNFLNRSNVLDICKVFADYLEYDYIWEDILAKLFTKFSINETELDVIKIAISKGVKGQLIRYLRKDKNINNKIIPLLSSEHLIELCLEENYAEAAYSLARKLNVDCWKYISTQHFDEFIVTYVKEGVITKEDLFSKMISLGYGHKLSYISFLLEQVILQW